jgi:hypothetical protein
VAAVGARIGAVVLSLGFLVAMAPWANASRSELTPAGEEGLAQIATCLRSNPNLVALLVVDESGSLQELDPDNKRAPILADFVLSLASLAGQETPQGPRVVEFAANTFAVESRPLIPWTTLTPENAQQISTDLRNDLPGLNQGRGTNYEDAVKGARSSISEGVAKLGSSTVPCKIVVWFTDGVLSVGDEAANAASAERLCAPTGPVNALRKDGINLLSVLLFDSATLDEYDESSRKTLGEGIALLQATAEGQGQSGPYEASCGRVPVPAGYAKGAFFEGSVDALAGQFAQAVALGSGGTPIPELSGSPVSFEIEPGFTSFWVTARAPNGFDLRSPQGDTLSGQPGSGPGQVAGTTADVTWTGDTFTAKIPVTQAAYGDWVLARRGMDDPVDVYLFSNYTLEVDPVELIADKPADISGRVISADGSLADLSGFSQADLTVTQIVDGQRVDPVPFDLNRAAGTFTGTFTPTTSSSQVRFDLTLALTTAKGFPLAPLSVSFVENVKLPGGYPTLSPTALSLGSLQDRGSSTSTQLRVDGSEDGPTQVCVVGIEPESEVAGANVALASTPSDGCIDIPASGSVTVDVTATLGNAVADGGEVSGVLTLTLINAPTPELPQTEPRDITVPVSVQVIPVGPVLWVPFVLTALGILLPLAALYLINSRAARLRLDGLMMARVPVSIDLAEAAQMKRTDGKAGPLLTHEDLSFTPSPNRAKSWSPGVERLAAKAPVNPFGAVSASVQVPDSYAVVSNQPPNSTATGTQSGVGLCPSMSAYLLVDREVLSSTTPGESVQGELVAYLVPENLQRDTQHLSSQITSFPAWADSLLAIKTARTGKAAAGSRDVDTADVATPIEPSGQKQGRFDIGGSAEGPPPATPPRPDRKSGGSNDDPPPPSSGNRFSL